MDIHHVQYIKLARVTKLLDRTSSHGQRMQMHAEFMDDIRCSIFCNMKGICTKVTEISEHFLTILKLLDSNLIQLHLVPFRSQFMGSQKCWIRLSN
uniref:Uncharacterized protein n=1 Tax=Ovis aries TaxID=9940 RepID=A0AC11CJZ6_SHEEP